MILIMDFSQFICVAVDSTSVEDDEPIMDESTTLEEFEDEE